MAPELNPYLSPAPLQSVELATEKQSRVGRIVLLSILSCEALIKTTFLAMMTHFKGFSLFSLFSSLAAEYPPCNRILFFLAIAFFIVETIGPWIGVYYLGFRFRSISFDKAIGRTLAVAFGTSILAAFVLMLLLEITVYLR